MPDWASSGSRPTFGPLERTISTYDMIRYRYKDG